MWAQHEHVDCGYGRVGEREAVGEPGQRLVTAPLMLSRRLESTYPEAFTSLCSS